MLPRPGCHRKKGAWGANVRPHAGTGALGLWASLALALLGPALPARAASYPPELVFRTLEGERAVIHYPEELDAQAREAAALADEILSRHEARYHSSLGKVQIVLTDTTDLPNGFTTPFPYPLVHIDAVAPDGSDDFGNHDGWLRLVLTHELAHAVHLEEAHGLVLAGRRILGRAPFLFPNSLTPGWFVEGLATYEETMGTAFGRGRNPDVRMVLRSASLEGKFPDEDRATLGLDLWPLGESVYFFGEAFLQDLSERFGRDTLPQMSRVHSGRVVPYLDEYTSYSVTGATFDVRWSEWKRAEEQRFAEEARRIEAVGVSPSQPLTARGVRQTGPRYSPSGEWIAYSSTSLDRFPSIRLIRPDGTGDHEVALRNGGSGLAWTPDGAFLVFDEVEIYRLFSTYSDLHLLDVAARRARPLTSGLRARDPDVSKDGDVVFVREAPGGSSLALIGLDGNGLRTLVPAQEGVEWSGPRFRGDARAIAAARLRPGGWLDIVEVDVATGAVTELTHDRAKDVEPTWTRDGRYVVFRSDRDGVSNLYAVAPQEGRLLRVTNVLGGAFSPDVAPGDGSLAFSSYSSSGYDIHTLHVDFETLPPAAPFLDPYPTPEPDPPPAMGSSRPYDPLRTLVPRFWSPYVLGVFSGETQFGFATGGVDPLFRHAWGLEMHRGSETGQLGLRGYYQYDRFKPTLSLAIEDLTDPEREDTRLLTRDLTLTASLPLERTLRDSQTLSFAWRRERQRTQGDPSAGVLNLSAAEVAWTLNSSRQYPYTVSPVEGWQLRLAALKEIPALGSDVSGWKAIADARTYIRLPRNHALALRFGGGGTLGESGLQGSFSAGGFPDRTLFDLVGTNVALLRGFADDSFLGRKIAYATAEYRFPLAHPERGYRTLPFFLRHVHGAVFADSAQVWSGPFRWSDTKVDLGTGIGGDFFVGHQIPLTWVAGVARGLGGQGETRVYTRVGLPF